MQPERTRLYREELFSDFLLQHNLWGGLCRCVSSGQWDGRTRRRRTWWISWGRIQQQDGGGVVQEIVQENDEWPEEESAADFRWRWTGGGQVEVPEAHCRVQGLQKEPCSTFQIQFCIKPNGIWSVCNHHLCNHIDVTMFQVRRYNHPPFSWWKSTLTRQPLTTSRETRRSRQRPSWVSLEALWGFSLGSPSSVGLRSSSFSSGLPARPYYQHQWYRFRQNNLCFVRLVSSFRITRDGVVSATKRKF